MAAIGTAADENPLARCKAAHRRKGIIVRNRDSGAAVAANPCDGVVTVAFIASERIVEGAGYRRLMGPWGDRLSDFEGADRWGAGACLNSNGSRQFLSEAKPLQSLEAFHDPG
jgi:hypothetical protein